MAPLPPSATWVSASELGDYEFCPRSHWYAQLPPDAPPTAASRAREARGERFHEAALGARARRSRRGGAYAALLLAGLILGLLAVALLLGGL